MADGCLLLDLATKMSRTWPTESQESSLTKLTTEVLPILMTDRVSIRSIMRVHVHTLILPHDNDRFYSTLFLSCKPTCMSVCIVAMPFSDVYVTVLIIDSTCIEVL